MRKGDIIVNIPPLFLVKGCVLHGFVFGMKPVSACLLPLSLSSSVCPSFSVKTQSLERPVSKRCSGLSTCVLGKLSQDLHKLQTFPRTNVGSGTPGRKRSAAENQERFGTFGTLPQRFSFDDNN